MKDEKTYLTPRELGLFVGQRCKYYHPDGVLDATISAFEPGFGTMVAVEEDSYLAEAKNVKPILRSLASITEDEASKFLAIKGNTSFIPTDHKGDILSPLSIVKAGSLRTPRLTCTPEGFLRLIGHGFDVFGWIEKGLAIEKTTT